MSITRITEQTVRIGNAKKGFRLVAFSRGESAHAVYARLAKHSTTPTAIPTIGKHLVMRGKGNGEQGQLERTLSTGKSRLRFAQLGNECEQLASRCAARWEQREVAFGRVREQSEVEEVANIYRAHFIRAAMASDCVPASRLVVQPSGMLLSAIAKALPAGSTSNECRRKRARLHGGELIPGTDFCTLNFSAWLTWRRAFRSADSQVASWQWGGGSERLTVESIDADPASVEALQSLVAFFATGNDPVATEQEGRIARHISGLTAPVRRKAHHAGWCLLAYHLASGSRKWRAALRGDSRLLRAMAAVASGNGTIALERLGYLGKSETRARGSLREVASQFARRMASGDELLSRAESVAQFEIALRVQSPRMWARYKAQAVLDIPEEREEREEQQEVRSATARVLFMPVPFRQLRIVAGAHEWTTASGKRRVSATRGITLA